MLFFHSSLPDSRPDRASAHNDHSHIFLLLDLTLRQPQGLDHQDKGSSRNPELVTWVETKDRSFRLATQASIPLFAIYNRLSKRPSSKTVETVRSRHFAASLARAASACCTRFSASTPRISRTGTSSLFASCTITSAIFRGSPSARPSRLRNTLSIEPTEAS